VDQVAVDQQVKISCHQQVLLEHQDKATQVAQDMQHPSIVVVAVVVLAEQETIQPVQAHRHLMVV
jgi:hypothetical protein